MFQQQQQQKKELYKSNDNTYIIVNLINICYFFFSFLFSLQNGTIRGMLLALQYLGKDKEGHGGIVINIGSAQSFRPQISTPIYCASKHAILALSKSCGVCKFALN